MLRQIIGIISCLLGCLGCVSQPLSLYEPQDGRKREEYQARAKNGMIASDHPLASRVGLEILKEGGNAIDAAIAVSFALSVVRPQSTGIGGGGFLLLHRPSHNPKVYDFRERAPAQAHRDMFLGPDTKPRHTTYAGQTLGRASIDGHQAVGVPGLVAGLYKVHKDHGRLNWDRCLQGAIKLADEGFVVYPNLESAIQRRLQVLKAYPSSRKIFVPAGAPLRTGDTLVQKDLAKTLRLIAKEGSDAFYHGKIAQLIHADMQEHGLITRDDLASYQVIERQAISGKYRGFKIASMPPPSSGGVHLVQILNLLQRGPIKAYGDKTLVHYTAESMRRAFADRARYLGDPDFVSVPTDELSSHEYARELARSIDPSKASLSEEVGSQIGVPYESSGTTHLSVVDSWGQAVSSTQTINYTFGSGVVAQETGIVLNNEMDDFSISPGVPNAYGLLGNEANAISARKTMLSSMSPTLVFDASNQLFMVLGAKGGPRIITSTLQTIVNVIDHRMSLLDAVHASRIHHQWFPDELRIEQSALLESTNKNLQEMGHSIRAVDYGLGSVEAIMREGNHWVGVSDSRSDGQPMGY